MNTGIVAAFNMYEVPTPANFVYDIRGASLEDVQKVATAISKFVNNEYDFKVTDELSSGYVTMFSAHPDYVGFQGVTFGNDELLKYHNDQMVQDAFRAHSKSDLLGVLTVEEAIQKFNL